MWGGKLGYITCGCGGAGNRDAGGVVARFMHLRMVHEDVDMEDRGDRMVAALTSALGKKLGRGWRLSGNGWLEAWEA